MIVVDASVAVKWALTEPGRDEALHVLKLGHRLVAPDLIYAEVANVFRKRMKRSEMTLEQAEEAFRALSISIQTLVPSNDLAESALRFALQIDHSAYDCFYLAATRPNSYLVTADDVFVRKCKASDALPAHVTALSDVASIPLGQDATH